MYRTNQNLSFPPYLLSIIGNLASDQRKKSGMTVDKATGRLGAPVESECETLREAYKLHLPYMQETLSKQQLVDELVEFSLIYQEHLDSLCEARTDGQFVVDAPCM